jgi:hypothetical protein
MRDLHDYSAVLGLVKESEGASASLKKLASA